MDKTMKLWQTMLASIVTGVIVGGIVLLFTRAGQHSDNNEALLNKKADIEYVDKQDASVKAIITAHENADEQKEQQRLKWMESIDAKLNILIAKK